MSDERRSEPRIDISAQQLLAHDALAEELLGSVINLSQHGLMLLSNRPIEVGGTLQLALHEAHAGNTDPIELGVRICWVCPASTPGNHWAGAHISSIENAHAHRLNALLSTASSESA